jgi:hypothetical protein
VRPLPERSSPALTTSITAIVLSVSLATVVLAVSRSKSIESTPVIWGAFGYHLQPPKEDLDAGTPIEPYAPFTAGAAGVPTGDSDSFQ